MIKSRGVSIDSDCFIESKLTFVDDWFQDTMDDKYHGTDSPGFLINETYSYSETFSVQGRSSELMYFADYFYEYFDFSYAGNTRFSEENLRREGGCYGVSFYVVYNIIFRDRNEPSDHISKFVIEDNYIVNVKERNMVDNTGDKADVPASELVPGFELIGVVFTLISLTLILRVKCSWIPVQIISAYKMCCLRKWKPRRFLKSRRSEVVIIH